MTRHQLRAARALLVLQQEVLADKAKVGITTLRRFENGNSVGQEIVDALRVAIQAEGVTLIAPGTMVDGVLVGAGVSLVREDDLPPDTKRRLSAIDLPSEVAAEAARLPDERRNRVGRRTRVPVPAKLRPKRPGRPREGEIDDGGDSQAD